MKREKFFYIYRPKRSTIKEVLLDDVISDLVQQIDWSKVMSKDDKFSQETKQKIEQAKQDYAQQMKQIADKYQQPNQRGKK